MSNTDATGTAQAVGPVPDKPALIVEDEVRTHGEFADRAGRLAAVLQHQGVRAGDKVAAMLPNGFEFFEASGASSRLGCNFIPINWHLKTNELAWILSDSGASALIAHRSLSEEVEGALAQANGCQVLWVGGDDSSYERAIREEDVTVDAPQAEPGTAVSYMFYTSGTTGKPKGAINESDGAAQQMSALMRVFGFRASDVHLMAGPAYHAAPGGWANIYLALGATVVVMPRWDALEWLRLVERYEVTTAFLVPSHFVRLFELPEDERRSFDMSSLRLLLHAGESCPVAVKEQAIREFPNVEISEYYGGSEAGAATVITKAEWLEHKGSVGRAMEGIDIRIVGDDGEELPAGEMGNIYYTPWGSPRYHNDAEKTAAAKWGGGYFTVGDIGYLDRDGYLYLSDRRVDMINRGGVNIYAREIEEALHTHPAIVDCAVIGIPDVRTGQAIKAIIETNRSLDVTDVKNHCAAMLAKYKIPQVIEFVDELPRDPNGKILKRFMREQHNEQNNTPES